MAEEKTKQTDVNPNEPHTFVLVPDSFPEKCAVCGGFWGDVFRPDKEKEGTLVHPQ